MIINTKINELIKFLLTYVNETERLVEVPFIFQELPEPSNSIKILDVGCCESHLLIELNKLGFVAYGIDTRGYPHPNSYVGDARKMPYNTNYFDVTLAISTIEHIGLVNTPYLSDTIYDKNGDRKVVEEIIRVTKPGGKIIITLPYGNGNDVLKQWIRFYDSEKLSNLLKGIKSNIKYHIFKEGRWMETDEKTCSQSYSGKQEVHNTSAITGMVCITGIK